MKNFRKKLFDANKIINEAQPELAEELNKLRKTDDFKTEAESVKAVAVESEGGLESAGDGNFALETIVHRTGRPVLAIQRNNAVLEFSDPKSVFWKEKLKSATSLLTPPIKAIGRIEVENHPDFDWIGTGWLVDSTTVVTNRHVASLFAKRVGSRFVYRQGGDGEIKASIDFLEEFGQAEESTFVITEILHIEDDNGPDIAFLRASAVSGNKLPNFIPLSEKDGIKDQEVVVVGYPARDSRIPDQQLMFSIFGDVYDKKRLAPGLITGGNKGVIYHDCSTLGGNSGSAIIDLKSGKAIGLHFAGRFLEKNFAVSASVIRERMEKIQKSIANRTNIDSTVPVILTNKSENNLPISIPQQSSKTTLEFTIPIHVSIRIGDIVKSQNSNSSVLPATVTGDDAEEFFTEANPSDYDDREGYDVDFLGDKVPLPQIKSATKKKEILLFDGNKSELKYCHFSVVMNKNRRQCFFSAVNIDGETSIPMKRGSWRTDPRIPSDAQIMKECYGNAPKFSRGHMTRREDPIWGPIEDARKGNDDSMHVTNTVPQMQNMNAGIWLALENYALQNARKDSQKISVFTGPVFKPSDPEKYGVIIPVSFWKVIAFIHDETGKLCATGYQISQEEFISEEEFVYGKHKTTQVSIRSIERATGLSFGKLGGLDPLETETEALVGPSAALGALTQIRFF